MEENKTRTTPCTVSTCVQWATTLFPYTSFGLRFISLKQSRVGCESADNVDHSQRLSRKHWCPHDVQPRPSRLDLSMLDRL